MPEQSLLIIDSESQSRDAIARTLHPLAETVKLVGSVSDLREGLRIIERSTPSIVILEARELDRSMKEVRLLLSDYPNISIFVTAHEKDPDWILRLIRAGASEYLTKPVVAEELAEAVRKVTRLRRHKTVQQKKKATIISVYNPCAGIGTTTIAVNVAAALAAKGKKVVLADLNLISADISSFLDLTPRYTLFDVAAKQSLIDASFLSSVLVTHPCGVHILCGTPDLRQAAQIGPELLRKTVASLTDGYDYLVIDAGGQLFGPSHELLSASEHIIFPIVLNLTALNTARRYLATMEGAGLGEDRVKVVVNRRVARDEITIADAEKVLGCRIFHTLPNGYLEVTASITRGIPLVVLMPKSPVAKALEELAAKLKAQGVQHALKGGAP